ncbi:palmitoyl-acyl carrier protein thioesterase, chloroplastic-like [Eucalyptus grandis]|uniref:palmitoyl-acyl carrier protein thioesterase, chloroplastic-like n=1 Tax=Eucalyptus grandis TaxID=71139 RepID=UPI00192ED7CF|nr:palmitoyl-acyl carrier protein thioesterase, chloroplastic-like [Eucalyptus grandis]
MCKRNLVWVICKMQIVVDAYPLWNSVIELDTWMFASERHGMRREWFIRDPATGKTMVKAIWVTVMMNKETRRLSNFTEEIRREIEVHTVNRSPVVNMDGTKLQRLDAETADYVRTGLAASDSYFVASRGGETRNFSARWYDLDVNHHVNNVKYINWILEGTTICSSGCSSHYTIRFS